MASVLSSAKPATVTVNAMENDRTAALQAIRIAERYNRLCKYSQAAPSWLRLTDKYFQLQVQRGGQTFGELEKREQIMVENVVDLTLDRNTSQAN